MVSLNLPPMVVGVVAGWVAYDGNTRGKYLFSMAVPVCRKPSRPALKSVFVAMSPINAAAPPIPTPATKLETIKGEKDQNKTHCKIKTGKLLYSLPCSTHFCT